LAKREIHHRGRAFGISYTLHNPNQSKRLLILHGWGSRKEVMERAFSKELSMYTHCYLDLPGFGGSSNSYVLTTKEYVEIVTLFLEAIGFWPDVIMGHSYGGKVATLLNPKTLILLSSAGLPQPKPLKVRAKIALFKALKPLGGAKIGKLFATKDVEGMAQNMYETLKNVVDEDFTEHFKAYSGHALLFWGESDTATPLHAGETMAQQIPNSHFYPLQGDHFFFLSYGKEIASTILSVLEPS